MKATTRDRILAIWDIAEEMFPDKSTEFLLQYVTDSAGVQYENTVSVVTTHRFKKVKK